MFTKPIKKEEKPRRQVTLHNAAKGKDDSP
jgi:hypothetical protein